MLAGAYRPDRKIVTRRQGDDAYGFFRSGPKADLPPTGDSKILVCRRIRATKTIRRLISRKGMSFRHTRSVSEKGAMVDSSHAAMIC